MTNEEFLGAVLEEAMTEKPEPRAVAIRPIPYTPEAMVELIIANPTWEQGQLAGHFGRNLSWFSSVLASEAFQVALAPRKSEIADPYLTATMEERFRALALQSLNVLSTKLEGKEVSEFIATKAAEIGVKALGLGQPKLMAIAAPISGPTGAEAVADRILAAMEAARLRANPPAVIDDVPFREVTSGS